METAEKTATKPTDPNVEIFAELLGKADVPEEKILPVDSSGIVTSSSSVMHCSHEDVIHWEPGLCDVAIGPGHVITCSGTDETRISVYPRTDSCRDVSDDRLRMSSDPLHRSVLPVDVMVNDDKDNRKDVTVLLYVEPGDDVSSECGSTAIDRRLFGALFRTQLRCNLPVVLLGRESGLVGYIPMGITSRDRSVPLEVLYHLEQPVVSIFGACVRQKDSKAEDSDSRNILNSLVLVGGLGKLVFITLQDSNPVGVTNVQFREYHLPSPVVCSAVNRNGDVLFYSTLKKIYAVVLSYTQKSKNLERSHNPFQLPQRLLPSSLSPISFPVPKVSALAVGQSTLMKTADYLLCIKTDGRVLLVEKPLAAESGIALARSTNDGVQGSSGEKIKQYLADIQEKTNCVNRITLEIRELDDVIRQLNIVTRVLCEILREHKTDHASSAKDFQESCSEPPGITFLVHVDYERQGGLSNPRVILRCDLENSTKLTLSRGWSMVVQVRTSQPWFNENCVAPQIVNHSVSLDSSSSHHISIHLEPSLSYLSPIEVSCYICFDMKEILPTLIKDSDRALTEEGFAVLVQRSELSILSFLRSVDAVSSGGHENSTNQIHLFQQTLKSLNTPLPSSASPSDQTSKNPESSSLSVHVSRDASEFIQKTIMEHGMADNLDGPISKELSVLYFLLFDSRKHLRFDNAAITGNYVLARTPNDEEVKFQVVHSVQGSSAIVHGLEVRVHTSSEALRCSIHSSLLMVLEVCNCALQLLMVLMWILLLLLLLLL